MNWIMEGIKKQRITRKILCNTLDISRSTLWRWIVGNKDVSNKNYERLKYIFGLDKINVLRISKCCKSKLTNDEYELVYARCHDCGEVTKVLEIIE